MENTSNSNEKGDDDDFFNDLFGDVSDGDEKTVHTVKRKRKKATGGGRRSIQMAASFLELEQLPELEKDLYQSAYSENKSCQAGFFVPPMCYCKHHKTGTMIKTKSLDIIGKSELEGVELLDEMEAAMNDYIGKPNEAFILETLREMMPFMNYDAKRAVSYTLKWVARLAITYEEKLGDIKLIGNASSITLSKEQCACLLSNAFMCTVAGNFSMNIMHTNHTAVSRTKIKMMLKYFSNIRQKMFQGEYVTFSRLILTAPKDGFMSLVKEEQKLAELEVNPLTRCEDNKDMLIINFGNAHYGGGVFRGGYAQEEMLLLKYPECTIAMVYCDYMKDNEAVSVVGAEAFCEYQLNEEAERPISAVEHRPVKLRVDSRGRTFTEIIAIDASKFNSKRTAAEFAQHSIERELTKAITGFTVVYGAKKPISTGAWGCGIFNGDKELKSCIQLIAASVSERDIVYNAMGDTVFAERFATVYKVFKQKKVSPKKLLSMLIEMKVEETPSVFDEILIRLL